MGHHDVTIDEAGIAKLARELVLLAVALDVLLRKLEFSASVC